MFFVLSKTIGFLIVPTNLLITLGDEPNAAHALKNCVAAKQQYDALTQASRPPQSASGQLSNTQRNFLSRRVAGGDELSPQRMEDYALAHTRAVNAGLEVDSPQHFAAVAHHADTMGDGRQRPSGACWGNSWQHFLNPAVDISSNKA